MVCTQQKLSLRPHTAIPPVVRMLVTHPDPHDRHRPDPHIRPPDPPPLHRSISLAARPGQLCASDIRCLHSLDISYRHYPCRSARSLARKPTVAIHAQLCRCRHPAVTRQGWMERWRARCVVVDECDDIRSHPGAYASSAGDAEIRIAERSRSRRPGIAIFRLWCAHQAVSVDSGRAILGSSSQIALCSASSCHIDHFLLRSHTFNF